MSDYAEIIPVKREPLRVRLTLDDGLASWVRALVASPVGIFGDERATIIFGVRTFILDLTKPGGGFRDQMMAYLPPDIQRACGFKPNVHENSSQ